MSGSYPPATWNVAELDECRTNNHLEGWHSKMRKVVGKAHPNVYELVRTFKMEQAAVEVQIMQIAAGARRPPRSSQTIEKNSRIAELKRRFLANELALLDYLTALAGHTNLVV